ncbi:MAG TPA: carboxypeptidase-like regulatory domain-containing protein [Candidatus Acidoferrum sp.]|nr:carboxypeptidase-like regulatory domain-containing protein [Candidatus Acidoferrum sp.]
MRSFRRIGILGPFLIAAVLLASGREAQASAAPAGQGSQSAESSNKKKSKHADDYLVHGTVFTPEGLSFPGAELRLRRTTEKKFHWNTYTNSRGEFAVRVKQGTKYEMIVRAKGFQEQSKVIDATYGNSSDDLVFRLELKEGKK